MEPIKIENQETQEGERVIDESKEDSNEANPVADEVGLIVKAQIATANRILELCEKQHISINKFANISAVPPPTLKNIINGKSKNTGISTIAKLCDGLEIMVKDF